MLAKTNTCAVSGVDGQLVEVEVDISPGLPRFNIVGLPDSSVQESRERVRAAIRNSGAGIPNATHHRVSRTRRYQEDRTFVRLADSHRDTRMQRTGSGRGGEIPVSG